MKRLLVLLLLSGCGSGDDGQTVADGAPAAGVDLNAEAGPGELSPAQLQARASEALRVVLADPEGARFANLRNGAAGAVCGHVDARVEGRHAGPKPFLVTPDGLALISPTAEIAFADAADVFADFYIRWCASPEELQRLGPRITDPAALNAQVPEAAAPDAAAAPAPPPPPPAPPPPAAEPRRTAPPQPAERARRPDDDSFLNAVVRKDERT